MLDTSEHWTDDPLSDSSQDRFGRTDYAARAADLIAASHSWDSSVVFGLTGPWGSGKSSLISMVEEALKARQADDWRLARFTPWATNDTEGLLAEFYSSLSDALPTGDGQAKFRRLAGRLVRLAAPAATMIPVAGSSVAAVAAEAGDWLAAQQPWDRTFARASAELRKSRVKVLVIADDIDRLQADELSSLLKVVRLLGRFPGVQYLLAYDEETIFRTLGASTIVSGDARAAQRFMEKIVQYPLVVPPLLKQQQITRLEAGINDALTRAQRRPTESSRLSSALDVLLSQLTTPRAISRFLAQIQHHLPMVPQDEINDDDVILLTLMRVAFPSMYGHLPAWRDVLLNGHSGVLKPGSKGVEYEPADLSPLLRDVAEDDKAAARKLLAILFPNLEERRVHRSALQGQRICQDQYFDRYFAMAIPDHDIADRIVTEAVALASKGQPGSLRTLLVGVDTSRAVLSLQKAEHGDLPDGDAAKLHLLRSLLGILPEIDDPVTTWLSPRSRATGYAASIVGALSSEANAEEMLETLSCAGVDHRLRIWMSVKNQSSPWYELVDQSLAIVARKAFLDNVRARDNAPQDDGATTALWFLIAQDATSELEALREDLRAGLKEGLFNLEDVAARLVATHLVLGVPGAEWELAAVDQQQWYRLGLSSDDPWYAEGAVDGLDLRDRSWANRRLFARGRTLPSAGGDPASL